MVMFYLFSLFLLKIYVFICVSIPTTFVILMLIVYENPVKLGFIYIFGVDDPISLLMEGWIQTSLSPRFSIMIQEI